MGVSGSGKSSVGRDLARALDGLFIEGDEFHPPANREKMAAGIPLTDQDRWSWLESIGTTIRDTVAGGKHVVATCSALKRVYRDRLRSSSGMDIRFVCLTGARAMLSRRMGERTGHFMPASLLDSQFATLELPDPDERAICVDVAAPLPEIVAQVMHWLRESDQPAR
jgi:gluconokinase